MIRRFLIPRSLAGWGLSEDTPTTIQPPSYSAFTDLLITLLLLQQQQQLLPSSSVAVIPLQHVVAAPPLATGRAYWL